MQVDRWVAAALAAAVMAGGCNGAEGEMDPKTAYETAIADLTEPVAIMAAYEPHLAHEVADEKYAPARRADEIRAAFYASDEVRHASNRARQFGKSPVTKELVPLLEQIARTCADPDEMPAVVRCRTQVKTFDEALGQHAEKAKAAGATGRFPRVAPEHITEAAKANLAEFKRALGPTETEKKYLAKRTDDKVTPEDLIAGCQAAAFEANEVMNQFEKAGMPELKKLAAIHKLSLDSACNRLQTAHGLNQAVDQCKQRAEENEGKPKPPPPPPGSEGDDPEQECLRICAQTKTLIEQGIPAAVFASIEETYEQACEKDEEEGGK